MLDVAKEMYRQVKTAHAAVHELLNTLEAATKLEKDAAELADIAYAVDSAARLLDNTRTRLRGIEELAEKIACLVYVTALSDEPIRTAYVTATPDVKHVSSLPSRRRDPDGYAALMTHLGVPPQLWAVEEGERPAVETHWPGMVDYMTRLAREGKPLPPGIDPNKTYPQYKLIVRPRREVDAAD